MPATRETAAKKPPGGERARENGFGMAVAARVHYFDYVGETSTGAIIATLVALWFSVAEIRDNGINVVTLGGPLPRFGKVLVCSGRMIR